MTDIVRIKRTDWLRAIATRMDAHDMGTHDDADEIRWAADEIERLETEVAELRRHTNSCPYSDAEFWCMCPGPSHDSDCLYDSEPCGDR